MGKKIQNSKTQQGKRGRTQLCEPSLQRSGFHGAGRLLGCPTPEGSWKVSGLFSRIDLFVYFGLFMVSD